MQTTLRSTLYFPRPRWGGVETLGMMLLGKRGQHGKLPLYNYASRWLWDNYDTYLLISRLLPRNEVGALSVGSSVLGTDQHTVPQNVNGVPRTTNFVSHTPCREKAS